MVLSHLPAIGLEFQFDDAARQHWKGIRANW